MTTVHMMLQKKGGVGKSVISTFWMQFLKEKGYTVHGVDTDPANQTFASFKELNVSKIELLDENEDIDQRKFDMLVETVFTMSASTHLIIDTGSSCFTSLYAYLKYNDTFNLFTKGGHPVYIHTPIAGGGSLGETTDCLDTLVSTFPENDFIIWKNFYHGELVVNKIPFEHFKNFPKWDARTVATIAIPHRNPATFGKDIQLMIANRNTFQAAKTSATLNMAVRQRLTMFWREACEAMEQGIVFDPPPEKDANKVLAFDAADKKTKVG
jgi:hypothetical protein